MDLRRIDEETMEGPIVSSLLDDDFYKFSMGQFIFDHNLYKSANVEWHFKNRTLSVPLGDHITEKAFGDQIDLLQQIQLDGSEHHYLAGTFEYGERRMFSDPYLQHLRNFKLPAVHFSKTDDHQLDIRWGKEGGWNNSTHGEISMLKIINVLYYRSILSKMSRLEREAVYAEGIKRLLARVTKLKAHPYVQFSDFGNRRSFSPAWHEYVVARVAEELPNQFKGTSSTSLAMKYALMPIGTCAHEISMAASALLLQNSDMNLAAIQEFIQKEWLAQYGYGLNISLPDTFGTEFCLKAYSDETVRDLKGFRIDSMDPIKAILLQQERYVKANVDFRDRLFIPSDGMDVDPMIEISSKFLGQGIISHGLGTNLTNDMGLKQLSIVCKPYTVNDLPCVKLSDNVLKATGDSGAIARYKKAAGYDLSYEMECKV